MKSHTLDWINIATSISKNPFQKVNCPNCSDSFIEIHIVPWSTEENKVDIHLICQKCGSRNTITKQAVDLTTNN